MINTVSKINLSKIGWEGGGSTSIWIMSLNILFVFLEYPLVKFLSFLESKEQFIYVSALTRSYKNMFQSSMGSLKKKSQKVGKVEKVQNKLWLKLCQAQVQVKLSLFKLSCCVE